MTIRFIDANYSTAYGSLSLRTSVSVITGISQAASAVVTAANNLVDGDLVAFAAVVGMTEINGLVGTVSASSSTGFTVDINSSGFTGYASAGTATLLSNVTNTVRAFYDDSKSLGRIVDTLTRLREKLIELGSSYDG